MENLLVNCVLRERFKNNLFIKLIKKCVCDRNDRIIESFGGWFLEVRVDGDDVIELGFLIIVEMIGI